jgi:hypothetical protein
MSKRLIGPILTLLVLAFSAVSFAQNTSPSAAGKTATKTQSSHAAPFSPRDLAGVWNPAPAMQPKDEPPVAPGRVFTKNDPLPPFTPFGKAKYEANVKFIAAGAVLDCDPYGTARNFFTPRPFEVLLTHDRLLQHFEYYDNWREIWTDGRKIPADAEPDYMGYSVGRWEGNVFVVESAAYNGKQFLSWSGLPLSESMHQTERWQRIDADTLKIVFTFDDPKIYSKPWTVNAFWKLKKDWTLDAHPCTLSELKEYDDRLNHSDKLPGRDYKP